MDLTTYERVYELLIDGTYDIEDFKEFLKKEAYTHYDRGFEAGYERGYNSIKMEKSVC